MKINGRNMDSIRTTPVNKKGGAVAKRLMQAMTSPPAIARVARTKRHIEGGDDQILLKKQRESETSVTGLNMAKPQQTSPITQLTVEEISKKLFNSPVTPATPKETTKALPNIALMTNIALMNVSPNVSPETTTAKASGGNGYDFDRETVSSQDDDADYFEPYTQKPKHIKINSISPDSPTPPVYLGSLHPVALNSLYGKVVEDADQKRVPVANSLYGKVVKDADQKHVHFDKLHLDSIKTEAEKTTSSDLQLFGESYILISFHID